MLLDYTPPLVSEFLTQDNCPRVLSWLHYSLKISQMVSYNINTKPPPK
jgi:hypothetical protein